MNGSTKIVFVTTVSVAGAGITKVTRADQVIWQTRIIRIWQQYYDKRRIIQDLYFLGIVSHIREPKDSTFFNFNAEIAINIGGSTAVCTLNLNGRANQRLIVFCINHITRYLKLLGT